MIKILVILSVIISATILLLLSYPSITGTSISSKYSYTTAICDDMNNCEDYYIECQENVPMGITPTGFSIKMSEDWIDTREEKNLCED